MQQTQRIFPRQMTRKRRDYVDVASCIVKEMGSRDRDVLYRHFRDTASECGPDVSELVRFRLLTGSDELSKKLVEVLPIVWIEGEFFGVGVPRYAD